MLVFISDLHFVDGTAGEHNPPTEAFEYFFDDLVSIAGKKSNAIKEIKIVLLGDIFDLLRTEKWFDEDIDENKRPWGYDEAAIEKKALEIFEAITKHKENIKTFETIRTSIKELQARCEQFEQCQLESPPRLIYLPGNHDRLVNKYSSLRAAACQCLGIPRQHHNPADPFSHAYEDRRYGVFARHGHEFDRFNYGGGESFEELDYLRVPIGDPITTELVARLPYILRKKLRENASAIWPNLSQDEVDRAIERLNTNFQEIENVRPFAAVIEWLLFQVKQRRYLKEVIEDTVSEAIDYFEGLEFVDRWYGRHDKWLSWRDEADKIQAVLFLFRVFKPYNTPTLWDMVVKAKEYFETDDLLAAAPQEYFHLPPEIRYVVYGHTHDPLVAPIRTIPNPPFPLEHIYLNTGTWRSRHWKATQDDSFVSVKNMTSVIFYREDERVGRKAHFETWSGTLKIV